MFCVPSEECQMSTCRSSVVSSLHSWVSTEQRMVEMIVKAFEFKCLVGKTIQMGLTRRKTSIYIYFRMNRKVTRGVVRS